MDRLDRIEATLDRAAKMYEKMVIRQVGIRNLYRSGARRMEDIADRIDHQDRLLEGLMESQLRTEANVNKLSETVDRFIKSQTKE